MKTVTIRMPEDLAEWLSEQGESINQTIVDLLSGVRTQRKYALKELEGKFTSSEWIFLAVSLTGTIIKDDLRYNNRVLIAHNEDSEKFDGIASQYGVDIDELNKKISSLTISQMDALYYRVEMYWNKEGDDIDVWANF